MKLTTFAFILGLPLVLAAATASFTYAWNSFTAQSQPVFATGAGVDTKDGYALTTVHDGDVEYLCVFTYAPYTGDKEEDKGTPRQFLTIYEVIRKTDGKAELHLIGSRCVEWDRGFELLNFEGKKDRPSDLRRLWK